MPASSRETSSESRKQGGARRPRAGTLLLGAHCGAAQLWTAAMVGVGCSGNGHLRRDTGAGANSLRQARARAANDQSAASTLQHRRSAADRGDAWQWLAAVPTSSRRLSVLATATGGRVAEPETRTDPPGASRSGGGQPRQQRDRGERSPARA